MCKSSSACHAYVMWAELGHSLFMCSKKKPVGHGLCLASSLLTMALLLTKVSLLCVRIQSTVSLNVRVEIS